MRRYLCMRSLAVTMALASVLAVGGTQPPQKFEAFSATSALSEARTGIAVASVGSRALFAGGTARVDIYDGATGQWQQATLSEVRASPIAAVVGSKVVFAGGLRT